MTSWSIIAFLKTTFTQTNLALLLTNKKSFFQVVQLFYLMTLKKILNRISSWDASQWNETKTILIYKNNQKLPSLTFFVDLIYTVKILIILINFFRNIAWVFKINPWPKYCFNLFYLISSSKDLIRHVDRVGERKRVTETINTSATGIEVYYILQFSKEIMWKI